MRTSMGQEDPGVVRLDHARGAGRFLLWPDSSNSAILVSWATRVHFSKLAAVRGHPVLTRAPFQIFQIICQSFSTVGWRSGLGKRSPDPALDPELFEINKWAWVATAPGNLASILARISISIPLIHIFGLGGKATLKWTFIIITVLLSLAGMVDLVLVWAQSSPIQGLWNPNIHAHRLTHHAHQITQIIMLGKINQPLTPQAIRK